MEQKLCRGYYGDLLDTFLIHSLYKLMIMFCEPEGKGYTLVDLCVMSDCVRLKSGEASKESLSPPELERRVDCWLKDENG